jgi:hypothetical protein
MVALFQLRPEKKDTVICLLLCHFNYDWKKKDTVVWPSFVAPFQLPLLRLSNYDRKKRYSRLSVVTPFQLRPEKKIQSSGHHSLRRSNCRHETRSTGIGIPENWDLRVRT